MSAHFTRDDVTAFVGTRIRERRQLARLSANELRQLSGVEIGTSTLLMIEKGDRLIQLHDLLSIAAALNTPLDDLLPGSER